MVKLVIAGGGSQSTPWLFIAPEITRSTDGLEIVLWGRDARKLQAVKRAAGILAPGLRVTAWDGEFERAVEGASVVILQARYGGYDARSHDERFPLAFGIPGDEGLGPGGLAAAWRSWPSVRGALQSIERHAPNAAVALLTAPLGILTRCAYDCFPQVSLRGLCELPWASLRDVCEAIGADPIAARFDYAGVNHLGWFDRIEVNGSDAIAAYSRLSPRGFPGTALIERLGAIPLKYHRLSYERSSVVDEQRATEPRGIALERLQQDAIAAYATGDRAAIAASMNCRPAPWYACAVAPFIAACVEGNTPVPLFLTTRNDGYIEGLSPSDVLERPFTSQAGTLTSLPRSKPLAPHLYDELTRLVEYERVAAQAVRERSHDGLVDALERHPWVQTREEAQFLANASM